MSAPVFSRRVAIGLSALTVISFIGGLLFAILGEELRVVESEGADTFSRAPIGHRAFLTLLQRLALPVTVSRYSTGDRAGADSVLLLLEPRVEASDPTARGLAELVRETHAAEVILVLPRWFHRGNDEDGKPLYGWSRDAGDEVLRALELEGSVLAGQGPWTPGAELDLPTPTLPRGAQVLSGGDWTPLLGGPTGALIARTHLGDRGITVIADPDLVNNAGLLSGDNAALVLEALSPVAEGKTLLIDETLHGFSAPPSIWGQLFRFPLVLVTLQVGVVLFLVLLAAMRRFGAPLPLAPPLGRGREVLVENTARLLWFGGHSADALESYWAETRAEVAERLHAPPLASTEEQAAWLDRVAESRKIQEKIGNLIVAVEDAGRDADRIVAAARRIHRWRRAMIETRTEV